MKILHITPGYAPDTGGIESFVTALAAGMQARGHITAVVTSHLGRNLPDEENMGGVQIHRVPFLTALTKRDPVGLLKSKMVTEHVKRVYHPDIIHLHIGGPLAVLHLMTAESSQAPLVLSVHDLVPPGQDSSSLRAVLEAAAQVAAISKARLEECQSLAPQAVSHMQLIHDSLPWRRVEEAIQPAPTPLILMVGRQVPVKGFDLALDAFQQVLEHVPGARMVLAGDGPLHADLARRAGSPEFQGAVELTGRLPDADLARLYRQAWVTLMPSLHSESFGLVALEAMQAGCPVIAARTGGLAEVVLDEETGLLVPVGETQALAEAMLRLIGDPAWARKLGQAGLERAKASFGWEACLNQYESLYHKALQGDQK